MDWIGLGVAFRAMIQGSYNSVAELPSDVLCQLFKYLGTSDKKAVSQTCRKWYEATAMDRKFMSEIYVVISKDEFEAISILGESSSRQYKNVVLKELDLDFSGTAGGVVVNSWSKLAASVEHLGIHNCCMREKSFIELILPCHALKKLSMSGCNELFMSGRLLMDSSNEITPVSQNLINVTQLSISSNRYLSDALLMRFIHLMPKLKHLCLSDDQISFHPGIKKKFYPADQEIKYSESVLTVGIIVHALALNKGTVVSLDLSRTLIDNSALVDICKVPNLRLRTLILAGCDQLSKQGFEAIAEFQPLIDELDVSSCSRFTDHTLVVICKSLKNLKKLNFSRCRAITDLGLQEIRVLTKLESLNLGRSSSGQLFFNGLLEALTVPPKSWLISLNLSTLVIEESVLVKIAQVLTRVEDLDLTACLVKDDTLTVIIKYLVNLRVLKLAYCDAITDRGLTGISTNIEEKDDSLNNAKENGCSPQKAVDGYKISLGSRFEAVIREDANRRVAFTKILECPTYEASEDSINNLKGLRELDLCGCRRISDISLIYSMKFLDLKILNLGYCNQVTDTGLESLVLPEDIRNRGIEELYLPECKNITDVGMAVLLPRLKRLRLLVLKGCSLLTNKTLDTIESVCPGLRYLDISSCQKMSLERADTLTENLSRLDTCITSGLRSGGLPGVQEIK